MKQQNRKHATKFMRLCSAILVMALVLGAGVSSCPLRVYAEGSADTSGDGGSRAYTEYGDHQYIGLEREQIIYAYVKAGETVYFGSDIYNSQLDINHNLTESVTGADIVEIDPAGVAQAYDTV